MQQSQKEVLQARLNRLGTVLENRGERVRRDGEQFDAVIGTFTLAVPNALN